MQINFDHSPVNFLRELSFPRRMGLQMWKSQEDVPSTSSSQESNSLETRTSSSTNLSWRHKKRLLKDSPGFLQRAISFQVSFPFARQHKQFLNRAVDSEETTQRQRIKQRYQDTSKYSIWPRCRIPDQMKGVKAVSLSSCSSNKTRKRTLGVMSDSPGSQRDLLQFYSPDEMPKELQRTPLPEPQDPRAILFRPDMEDHKSPYLACTINDVLRSDSEDSSDAEELIQMTRL